MSDIEESSAYRDLAREIYWAQDRASRPWMDTPEVRDRLHDLAAQLRADEKVVIPMGEGNLASPSRWRRELKFRLFRLMRPISWRYDRLLADHAELSTRLAERLMDAEAQIAGLRARLDGDAKGNGDADQPKDQRA